MTTHDNDKAHEAVRRQPTATEMLRKVLEWPNPNGTIENAYLPPWLAKDARSAITASESQAAPAATVGLDALREAVSDFRKAAIEFAKGADPDDHKRMMEAQKRIFDAALADTPTATSAGGQG